jgi:hypothetical protein
MLLLVVALRFWRSAVGTDRFTLFSVAIGVAVLGISHYKSRRALDQLTEALTVKHLSALYLAANLMAISGYGICEMALSLAHYR